MASGAAGDLRLVTSPVPLAFYDAANPAAVPSSAEAVAGYVDGAWPSLAGLRERFPKLPWLSITVNGAAPAMCVDVEAGDFTPAGAARWIRDRQRAGVYRPVVYCSLSRVPDLEAAIADFGIPRRTIRLWTAHWTGTPHICSPSCGVPMIEAAGATQWAGGRAPGYDVSLTSLQWFDLVRRDFQRGTPG